MTNNITNSIPYTIPEDQEIQAFLQNADALLVGPKGLTVALKIDVKAIKARDFKNMTCDPQVVAKGDGWLGKQFRKFAFANNIPVCKCQLPILQDLFDNVNLGDVISYGQFRDVLLHISNDNVMDIFFMSSARRWRTAKAVEMHKQRIIRKGHMYKLFVETQKHLVAYDTFSLYSSQGDEKAIERAYSNAKLSDSCLLDTRSKCPEYTFPFRLFCVNATGDDRFVHQYKPSLHKPPWKIYVVYGNRRDYNNGRCFYSQNNDTAIQEAHNHIRTSLIHYERLREVPKEYAPCPYQIFHEGELIYEYTPPAEIEVNPEYLKANRYRDR